MNRKVIFCADGFDPQLWRITDAREYTWLIKSTFLEWRTQKHHPNYSAAMTDALDTVAKEHPELIETAEAFGFSIAIMDASTMETMTITQFG